MQYDQSRLATNKTNFFDLRSPVHCKWTGNKAALLPVAAVLLGAGTLKLYAGLYGQAGQNFPIGAIEIVFSLGLIFSQPTRAAYCAAAILFSIFSTITAYEFFAGSSRCGCFGKVIVTPGTTLFGDLIFATSLWLAFICNWHRLALFGTWAALLWLSVHVGWIGWEQSGPSNRMPPQFPLSRSLPKLHSIPIDLPNDLKSGSLRLVIYRDGCEECAKEIPILLAQCKISMTTFDPVPWVFMQVDQSTSDSRLINPNRLPNNARWLQVINEEIDTPLLLLVRDGEITGSFVAKH